MVGWSWREGRAEAVVCADGGRVVEQAQGGLDLYAPLRPRGEGRGGGSATTYTIAAGVFFRRIDHSKGFSRILRAELPQTRREEPRAWRWGAGERRTDRRAHERVGVGEAEAVQPDPEGGTVILHCDLLSLAGIP